MVRLTFGAVVGAAAILGFLVLAWMGRAEPLPFLLALVGSAAAAALENRAMALGKAQGWRMVLFAIASIAVWAAVLVVAVRVTRLDDFPLSAFLGLIGGRFIGDALVRRRPAEISDGGNLR